MKTYSQCGQDLFVLNLLKIKNGTFLDLGCYLPKNINNTFLLEQNGWVGISLDINDYSNEWSVRKNKFIQCDCLNQDYNELLSKNYDSNVIDYLTLDMEALGDRYALLDIILKTNYEFKIITIEHDSHLGQQYINNEKIPQRELLTKMGYELVCADVSHKDYPNDFYEDWWVNKKYFTENEYKSWISNKESFDKILNKNNINHESTTESMSWY
jgi:predicted nucleic-acid-binding Zn-ribbon protein